MKRNISRLFILISISLLVSCSSLQDRNSAKFESNPNTNKLKDSNRIKEVLYSHYNEWQGVRYRYGGLSRNGIDCSGFVHLTFKSKLGLHLPRTTRMQSRLGKEVGKNDLKAGDLVFFRTGPGSKHVGIYLEKNKFLHASQKQGITISRLDHVYWKSNYWKSVRI